MQNRVRTAGNKAYITLPAVNGRQPLPETEVVIDLKNLPIAQEFMGTWAQSIHQKTGQIYVRGRFLKDGKRQQPVLSRLISGAKPGENTSFKNGDTLDCTEMNLVRLPICEAITSDGQYRTVKDETDFEKMEDYCGKRLEELQTPEQLKPSKGVSFHKGKRKWEVKPYYQGQRHSLGYWPEHQLKEANEAADFFRENGPEAYKTKFKGGN